MLLIHTVWALTWPSKHETLTQCCFNVGRRRKGRHRAVTRPNSEPNDWSRSRVRPIIGQTGREQRACASASWYIYNFSISLRDIKIHLIRVKKKCSPWKMKLYAGMLLDYMRMRTSAVSVVVWAVVSQKPCSHWVNRQWTIDSSLISWDNDKYNIGLQWDWPMFIGIIKRHYWVICNRYMYVHLQIRGSFCNITC